MSKFWQKFIVPRSFLYEIPQIQFTQFFFFNPPTEPIVLNLGIKSGKKGIVVSSTTRNPSGQGGAVTLYEISHQPWEEVGVTNKTSFLTPKELPYVQPLSAFDVASDGSVYSAIFVPYDPNCGGDGCPVYAVLTKFVNGQVVWQNYWETADPVSLQDITANKNGVSLLVTVDDRADSFAQKSTILTFAPDGSPVSNVRVPLEKFRDSLTYLPIDLPFYYTNKLIGLKTDDSGVLIAYGENYILSGTLNDGFTHSYLFHDGKTGNPYLIPNGVIDNVMFKDGYLFAHANATNDIIMPFDASLQPR